MTHGALPRKLDPALPLLFNDLPDPVRVVGRDGRVLFLNEAARLTAPEGLGHLCGGDGSVRDPSCPECQLAEVLERGLFLRWHVAVPKPDGSKDYFEITLSPVRDRDGHTLGALEILGDATVKVGLEQYLIGRAEQQDEEIEKHSAEAERLHRTADTLEEQLGELRETQTEMLYKDRLVAVSQVVAGLAHEVHTPLGAMLSSADLLRRTLQRTHEALAGLPEQTAAKLQGKLTALDSSAGVLVEGARRIQALIQTLRVFSRLDEAPLKPVNLHEGLDSAIEFLSFRISERVRVVREYGELPPVHCRPDACNQVFMNLLLNAVQAIEENGTVHVRTRREGSYAVVEIQDSGRGFSAEQQARLFELGYTTRRGRGGSGIGLSLVRRIVGEHGGTIEARSEPGQGATFTVRLPIEADRSSS